jgi:hypothetical protein
VEELMVALARADAARHAHLCLDVIDRARPPGMSSTQLAMIAFPARFAGVEMPMLPEAFHQLVRDLPDAPTSLRALVAASVGPQRFGELAAQASPEAAVGLLEAHQGGPERQRFAETLRRLSPAAGPFLGSQRRSAMQSSTMSGALLTRWLLPLPESPRWPASLREPPTNVPS